MLIKNTQRKGTSVFLALSLLFAFCFLLSISPVSASAQSIDELQSKIDQRTSNIKALEAEIASYQKQLTDIGNQASSLSSTIKSLDLTKKKLEADIKLTENKIIDKNIQIRELGSQIYDKEETISENQRIIGQSLSSMGELSGKSILELILSKDSLSGAWDSLDDLGTVQQALIDRIAKLRQVKAGLESNKKATEQAKSELVALSKQLSDQKKIVLQTTAEKNQLLKETKNNQASYASLLALRKQQKEAFEREVSDLEASIKLIIDPNSIPKVGSSIFRYPLDNYRITQYFGGTTFATRNPQVYKGSAGQHNGVDFAASIGTPVKAVASGVVSHAITTRSSLKCGYGNWISIKHPNGLTTLYAHLSLNSVNPGKQVSTGDVIGYSGNSGYTTGPHLHFGVYVTEGFKVTQSMSCPSITIPYAAFNAYLNPLSYF